MVSVTSMRKWVDKDPVLSKEREAVSQGKWKEVPNSPDTTQYRMRSYELSVQNNCLLWGNQVVVPKVGRVVVMQILHEGHPGISRMTALARGVV